MKNKRLEKIYALGNVKSLELIEKPVYYKSSFTLFLVVVVGYLVFTFFRCAIGYYLLFIVCILFLATFVSREYKTILKINSTEGKSIQVKTSDINYHEIKLFVMYFNNTKKQ